MKRLAVFVLTSLSCMYVCAEIVLFMPEIPGAIQNNGQGAYDSVLHDIIAEADVDVRFEYRPLARAIMEFSNDKNSCWPIANKALTEEFIGGTFIDTEVYYNKSLLGFFGLHGRPLFQNAEEVIGKRISVLRGEILEPYGLKTEDYLISYVDTHEQSIKMLRSGRIDAMFAVLTDLLYYVEEVQFTNETIVFVIGEAFVCHPGNEAFIK